MMNALIDAAEYHLSQRRSDFFCGGNMFVYYSATQAKNQDFRGPDFFAVLDVENEVQRERRTWTIWDEDGRYPDVIIELMSESTAAVDLTEKKHLYERTFRTRNYFVYDPYQPTSLQGWRLDENFTYAPLEPNELGRLWCEMLECWVGVWEGEVNGKFAPWLRFFDRDGNLVPLPKEAVQAELDAAQAELDTAQAELDATQAELERERQRSQAMAERLRELGLDPNNL
jgi:Uma2 family endonuclease